MPDLAYNMTAIDCLLWIGIAIVLAAGLMAGEW